MRTAVMCSTHRARKIHKDRPTNSHNLPFNWPQLTARNFAFILRQSRLLIFFQKPSNLTEMLRGFPRLLQKYSVSVASSSLRFFHPHQFHFTSTVQGYTGLTLATLTHQIILTMYTIHPAVCLTTGP